MNRLLVPLAVVLGAVAILSVSSIYTIREGQQALLFRFGEVRSVQQDAGLYIKAPVLDNVIYLEKRLLRFDLPPREVILGDSKRLVVDAIARYRIIDPLKFYQRATNEVGLMALLEPILDSNLREQLGQAQIAEVISVKRNELMVLTATESSASTKDLGIEIVDVRIVRADLPRTNTENVVRRMITEREREAMEERAQGRKTAEEIKANADRDSTIIVAEAKKTAEILRGQGEAERNRIFADAYSRDPEFFEFYRSMQAYRKSLNQNDTTMILSPDSEFFRYFGNDSGGK
jgi:modulator of FtsH protease HflC